MCQWVEGKRPPAQVVMGGTTTSARSVCQWLKEKCVQSWQRLSWLKRPAIIVIDSATYLLMISLLDINKVAMSLYEIMWFLTLLKYNIIQLSLASALASSYISFLQANTQSVYASTMCTIQYKTNSCMPSALSACSGSPQRCRKHLPSWVARKDYAKGGHFVHSANGNIR